MRAGKGLRPIAAPFTVAAPAGTRIRDRLRLSADHLAACVIDACGNPIGEPISIPIALAGPAAQRDGRLWQAISDLIRIARQHGCAGIAIENLGFDDVRNLGRESMGRGRRGRPSAAPLPASPPPAFASGCAAWRATAAWS